MNTFSMPFGGTFRARRYTPRRALGRGGTAVVFEAWDEVRQIPVAVKTLDRESPDTVRQLKNEFRSLAGVSHRNLVTLHELVHDQDTWLLVMDLVEGSGWLEHVRRRDAPQQDALEERLRDSLVQVVCGVQALHVSGWLHRDLKPSNVRVSSDGLVKVLDFGLVRSHDAPITHDGTVAGTPVYMAPEQAAGVAPGPHSDWYALGVMLFQGLTGRLPFSGSMLQVLRRKQEEDAPKASGWNPRVAPELDRLCSQLLARNVAERPGAEAILEQLSRQEPRLRSEVKVRLPRRSHPSAVPFVSREQELDAMATQRDAARHEGARVVYIVAPSGLGKTALAQEFLRRCRAESSAIFQGRCYERESMPFKGIDGVIDGLVRYLNRLPRVHAAALLPRDAFSLRTLFPAFQQVSVIAEAPEPRHAIPGAAEHRRRAFLALKELLGRLADRTTVVLFVDDVQWGDADGAALLTELLRTPRQPNILVVIASRPTGGDQWTVASQNAADTCRVQLGPLEESASLTLADMLLQGQATAGERPKTLHTRAKEIAHESGGHPLFVLELVRHLAEQADRTAPVRLDNALRLRVQALAGAERRLLSVVAVSATPLTIPQALQTAELGREGESALRALQADHLLRGTGDSDKPMVEAQHDRVREIALSETPPPERKRLHKQLAETLIADGAADAEKIAEHLEEAGEVQRALRYAIDAAESAAAALAFVRAARLYETALRFDAVAQAPASDGPSVRRYHLEVGMAEALASGGRGPEAAEAYLRAADASEPDARECRRRAAEQLLRSGHTRRGMALLEGVLAEAGLALANTPNQAVARTLWHRAKRSFRKLKFERLPEDAVTVETRQRADLAWTVSNGLTLVDRLRSAEFHARYLPEVLAVGDPFRAARALALESAIVAAQGVKARKTSRDLIRHAEAIAKEHHDAGAVAWVTLGYGFRAYLLQHWQAAHDYTEESLTQLRNGFRDVTWETTSAAGFHYLSATYLGRLAYVTEQLPAYVREVEERGDLFARSRAITGLNVVAWLARGDGAEAERMLAQVDKECEGNPFQIRDVLLVLARTYLDHYRGEHQRAYDRFVQTWKPAKRAFLHHVEIVRLHCYGLRGLSALAADHVDGERDAARCLAALEKEQGVLAKPYALTIRASLACRHGDAEMAAEQLGHAGSAFQERDMHLHAQATALVRALVQGGSTGAQEAAAARAWFRQEQVADPDALARSLVPGFVR